MWLWIRATAYMLVVFGGWLIVLPMGISLADAGFCGHTVRTLPFKLGAGVLGGGATALATTAIFFLVRYGQGTPLPLDPTKQLVTHGPYRFVRNPMAIALVLMVGAEVLLVRSRHLWMMLPLTLLFLELVAGPIEERLLVKQFGGDYRSYAARVRKWIPRRGRAVAR